jgi:hypothetical protein
VFVVRRILDLTAALLLLAALFLVPIWIDSYYRSVGERLPLLSGHNWTNYCESEEGMMSLRIWGPGKAPVPEPLTDEWLAARAKSYHSFRIGRAGIAWGDLVCYGHYQHGRGVKFYDDIILHVVMPTWSVMLLLLIFPTVWWGRCFKNCARLTGRLCPQCGYDLRATPHRCPECGRENTNFTGETPVPLYVPSSTCNK